MRIGIGIDTGGTYTDAVLYDFDTKSILYSAKALTTKEDLSVGIGIALDGLPADTLKKAEIVSLSTTLATNACVEEKGGRGKLVFIGGDEDVVLRTGEVYGLPDSSEIFFLEGEVDHRGEIKKEPDWEAFIEDSRDWIRDADAIAVVQQLGIRNSTTEQKAKELITSVYGLNTICGYELFSDLNYVKRGASTLLNARLMPVIKGFLDAIKIALKQRSISAPVVIVRSDGSLMSEKFTTIRPVETLLCGPAASVMGGIELTGEKNCLIIDMGGTTTDIAIVKDAVPVKAKDGVKIGKWQTFVKAVYIDTFGLGGDSSVNVNNSGELILGTSRVIPLCIAASKFPEIKTKLRRLYRSGLVTHDPLQEFFYLVKDVTDSTRYSLEELRLCAALKEKGPLIYSEAAGAINKRIYSSHFTRLEKEGVIMRCGLTPTDMMHVKGDFDLFDTEAAVLGTEYLSQRLKKTPEEVAEIVYDKVKERLYFNIVRMLLEDKYPHYKKNGLDPNLEKLVSDGWSYAKGNHSEDFLQIGFQMPASLVGVGAPIHLFLPDVAKALGTKCIIPEHAGVANALGAIVGNITAIVQVEVKPDPEGGFIVFGKTGNIHTHDYNEALKIATKEAKEAAKKEARSRGATGEISVSTERVYSSELAKQMPEDVFLSTTIAATAIGRVIL